MGFNTNAGVQGLLDGSIDWAADTIKARLLRTSESGIDQDDIALTGIGTAFEVTLGTKTGPTKSDALNKILYGCANPVFPGVSGAEIDRMAVYKFVTNDADSILIAVVDITPQTHATSTTITVTLTDGILFTANT